jgi:hypothetical protein
VKERGQSKQKREHRNQEEAHVPLQGKVHAFNSNSKEMFPFLNEKEREFKEEDVSMGWRTPTYLPKKENSKKERGREWV